MAIEYSGHGKSSGEFTKGNISEWSKDVKNSIKKIVKKNSFILIGSSMGAWISLNQFKYFKNQIVGFVGIGSAPEFLERLMWKKFPKKIKGEIKLKGISHIKNGDYEYPITYQIIKDGRKNKVFSKNRSSKLASIFARFWCQHASIFPQKIHQTFPKIDPKMHRFFDRFLHRFFFDFASILEANLEPCWPLFRSKYGEAN